MNGRRVERSLMMASRRVGRLADVQGPGNLASLPPVFEVCTLKLAPLHLTTTAIYRGIVVAFHMRWVLL